LTSLESFILADKSIADIIADFKASFPAFTSLTDPVLTRYINQSFCIVPAGFVNCGFDCAYDGFLYGLAHNLVFNDVLTGGIPSLKKNVASKSAGGLAISYQNLVSNGTPTNIANYFGTTTYGMTMLAMLDACGLTNSCGGFIV
jgi:hypothetical protein